MPPGVLRPRRQAKSGPLLLVLPPPDPDFLHPVPDQFQVVFSEPELPSHGRRLQQPRAPGWRQGGSPPIGASERNVSTKWLCAARAPIGNAEGDAEGLLLGRTEYRLDVRGIQLNLGDHHQDVAGRQFGVALEPVQQVVVEDLQLPQRAVTGVDLHRIVLFQDGCSRHFAPSSVLQIQDVGLDVR